LAIFRRKAEFIPTPSSCFGCAREHLEKILGHVAIGRGQFTDIAVERVGRFREAGLVDAASR